MRFSRTAHLKRGGVTTSPGGQAERGAHRTVTAREGSSRVTGTPPLPTQRSRGPRWSARSAPTPAGCWISVLDEAPTATPADLDGRHVCRHCRATIAGASVMTIGLAVGGLGIAVTSGVSGYWAIQAGDTAGAIAGGIGVGAGLAITAGAIGIAAGVAAAPVVLAVGIKAAVGVGIFHLGRHFDWW
jgi:hypothetical protein